MSRRRFLAAVAAAALSIVPTAVAKAPLSHGEGAQPGAVPVDVVQGIVTGVPAGTPPPSALLLKRPTRVPSLRNLRSSQRAGIDARAPRGPLTLDRPTRQNDHENFCHWWWDGTYWNCFFHMNDTAATLPDRFDLGSTYVGYSSFYGDWIYWNGQFYWQGWGVGISWTYGNAVFYWKQYGSTAYFYGWQ